MHNPEASALLSTFPTLDERGQAHLLHLLQKASVAGDRVANTRLLFAEALQVVSSLSYPAELPGSNEETTAKYLNAIELFDAAFESMQDPQAPVRPEEMLDDYVFVRAVFTRLHRVQAAISLRIAEDVEKDLRHFAINHKQSLPTNHFQGLISRAFESVPAPSDDYWAQLEHVPRQDTDKADSARATLEADNAREENSNTLLQAGQLTSAAPPTRPISARHNSSRRVMATHHDLMDSLHEEEQGLTEGIQDLSVAR